MIGMMQKLTRLAGLGVLANGSIQRKANVKALRDKLVLRRKARAVISFFHYPWTGKGASDLLTSPPPISPPHMPTVVDHMLILLYSPMVVPVASLVEGSYRALMAPRIPPSVPPLIRPPLGGGGAG